MHLTRQVAHVLINPCEPLVQSRIYAREALFHSAREIVKPFVWPG